MPAPGPNSMRDRARMPALGAPLTAMSGGALKMVEAAGVEPASEAASLGISTSVSRNLISPWGSSRRDPSRPASVNVPAWSRGASGRAIRLFYAASRFTGTTGGDARDLVPGISSLPLTRRERDRSACWQLCFLRCNAHAFDSQSRSPTTPSRPDAPTSVELLPEVYPDAGRLNRCGASGAVKL